MADGVGGVAGSYEAMIKETSETARKVNNEMDKDMFFKLLVTQLQNQDPMNPMEDRDFIAQLAQFTSLEQMTQLNETNLQSYTFSLVGKNALAYIPDPNNAANVLEIVGKIDTGFIKDGEACFLIGEYLVKGSQIAQIFREFDASEMEPPTTGNDTNPPEGNTPLPEAGTDPLGENEEIEP